MSTTCIRRSVRVDQRILNPLPLPHTQLLPVFLGLLAPDISVFIWTTIPDSALKSFWRMPFGMNRGGCLDHYMMWHSQCSFQLSWTSTTSWAEHKHQATTTCRRFLYCRVRCYTRSQKKNIFFCFDFVFESMETQTGQMSQEVELIGARHRLDRKVGDPLRQAIRFGVGFII